MAFLLGLDDFGVTDRCFSLENGPIIVTHPHTAPFTYFPQAASPRGYSGVIA
jgi:hypothetical protein